MSDHLIDLRKLARGKPCMIRVPGFCNNRPDTTVLCHVRLIGVSAASHKSYDVIGAYGCSDCHAVVDGQRHAGFSYEQRRLMLLEGVARTLAWLVDQDMVQW